MSAEWTPERAERIRRILARPARVPHRDDLAAALAEIDRLRERIEADQRTLLQAQENNLRLLSERDRLRAEVERLEGQVQNYQDNILAECSLNRKMMATARARDARVAELGREVERLNGCFRQIESDLDGSGGLIADELDQAIREQVRAALDGKRGEAAEAPPTVEVERLNEQVADRSHVVSALCVQSKRVAELEAEVEARHGAQVGLGQELNRCKDRVAELEQANEALSLSLDAAWGVSDKRINELEQALRDTMNAESQSAAFDIAYAALAGKREEG